MKTNKQKAQELFFLLNAKKDTNPNITNEIHHYFRCGTIWWNSELARVIYEVFGQGKRKELFFEPEPDNFSTWPPNRGIITAKFKKSAVRVITEFTLKEMKTESFFSDHLPIIK